MTTAPMTNTVADSHDNCEKCGAPVYGYVEERCCSGDMCACRGMPVSPCWCDACWKTYTEEAQGRAEFMAVNS